MFPTKVKMVDTKTTFDKLFEYTFQKTDQIWCDVMGAENFGFLRSEDYSLEHSGHAYCLRVYHPVPSVNLDDGDDNRKEKYMFYINKQTKKTGDGWGNGLTPNELRQMISHLFIFEVQVKREQSITMDTQQRKEK